MRSLCVLIAALAAAGSGCSSSTDNGGSGDAAQHSDSTSEPVSDGLTDGLADGAGDANGPGKPAAVSRIETLASPTTAQAGETVEVSCAALDANGDWIQGVPTAFWVVAHTGPYLIDADQSTVVFQQVGIAEVQCRTVDGELVDETPRVIEVIAGDPASVETTVTPLEIVAGDKVTLTCDVYDAFGNRNEWAQPEPELSIDKGFAVSGLQVKIAAAGLVDVGCALPDYGVRDDTPEQVKVKAGAPRTLRALLAPAVIEAGQKSALTCRAEDAWGNSIPGFPMSVSKPAALTLQGLSIGSFVAGIYEVRCVPSTDPWEWYDIVPGSLHVLPGPPSDIYVELLPPKPVYQKNDTVEMAISVLDLFGNVVSDAEIAPIAVQPPTGAVALGPSTYRFEEEAIYAFTIAVEDYPDVFTIVEIVVDGTGPLLVIEQPARGATLTGKPAVNVTGFVSDEVAGIVNVSINGNQVNVKPDGTFTYLMQAQQGMNLIIGEAIDVGGQLTRTSRSFFYSSQWFETDALHPDQGAVPDGMAFWLGQGFLDDGIHDTNDPDDMATLILRFLQNLNLLAEVGSPAAEFKLIGSWSYKLYITDIGYQPPSLSIDSFNNGIRIDVKLPSFFLKMKLTGKCKVLFFDVCPDFSGKVTANPISLVSELLSSVGPDGQAAFAAGASVVQLVGLDVDINGILGDLFDFLVDWLVGLFADQIEAGFEAEVGAQTAALVGELFASLAVDTTVEIPPIVEGGQPASLAILSDLSTIAFDEPGGVIALATNIVTAKKVAQKPLGSIGRASCLSVIQEPPYLPPGPESEFGIAIHDDFFNKALFSTWWSGLLNVQLDQEQIGELGDIDELTSLGIDNLSVKTVFFAAPMLTSCNPAQQMKLQIGDLFVQLDSTVFEIPLSVGMFVSAELDAELMTMPNADTGQLEIVIALQGITRFELEVVAITEGFEGASDWIKTLIEEEIVGGLVESFEEEVLPGIPIPDIDLSQLDPSFEPGTLLGIQLTTLRRWAGYTAVDGIVD